MGESVNSPCPSIDELRHYAEGRLDDAAATNVADHLEKCDACQQAVEDAERKTDWLLGPLRRELPGDPLLQEEQCLASIRRAHQVARDGSLPTRSHKVAANDETAPASIREYKLVRTLGQGGMGTVYEAVHTRLGRTVAVKVLPPTRTKLPEAVARFHREMEAVGRLDHPNIVRATDAGEFDGRHFLVMEYVDGCDVARLAERLGPLSVVDACEVVRQAAMGLAHVHEHGLVHRDVKPSNLLLSRGGDVKVTDLGLALLEPRLATVAGELTESGQIMGTLDYMAPEQADRSRVDIRADVYGLGATLFKLLTGRAPLEGPHLDTPLKKVAALADFHPPDAAELRPDLPPDLVRLMSGMLAKEPGDRPSAPGEVARALQPFATGARLRDRCAEALGNGQRSPEQSDAAPAPPHFASDHPTPLPSSTTRRTAVQQRRGRRPFARPWVFITALLLIIGLVAVWAAIAPDPDRDGDVDREVAELVLNLGGVVDLAYRDDFLPDISDPRELPSEPFRVDWIKLTGNPRVGDEHLKQFAQLKHLQGVALQETGITDEGVRHLSRIPTLDHAYLNDADLTDDGVRPLTELELDELMLNDTQITDTTLQRLAGQSKLTRLHVSGTGITNDGLKHVGRMASLRWLDLRDTGITDAGLAELSALTNLEEVDVSGTDVSAAAAAQLEVKLPGCQVIL